MENIENEEISSKVKKRGFWLSAFLILMFIANPITAFMYFSNPESITSISPNVTTSILYFLGVMCMINVILAAGIWAWKKWGVYGFYAVVAIGFVTNIYIGIGVAGSLAGLIGALIIFLTTRNRWKYFS